MIPHLIHLSYFLIFGSSSTDASRRIWAQLEGTVFKGFSVVFDGRRLAFSLKDIGTDRIKSPHIWDVSKGSGIYKTTLPEDDSHIAVSKKPPREFQLRIRKAGQLNTREILLFLVNKFSDESTRFTGTLLPSPSFA